MPEMNTTTKLFRALPGLFFFVAMAVLLPACGQDKDVREQATKMAIEESIPEMLPAAKAEGKIVSLDTTKIVLDNTSVIDLPKDKDVATIFLVRNAETKEGSTALSEKGMARAGFLATQLQKAHLLQVFCSKDNASLQTANFVARSNEAELNYLNTWDSREMAATLISSYRGKRVLLVATPDLVSKLLQHYLGNKKLKTPDNEYENIYVIFAKDLGDVELHHLLF